MADNKKWINENTAKIEALAERVEGITLENKAVADELETQSSLLTSLESAVDKLPEPKPDRLQWKCDNMKSLYYEFYGATYERESAYEILLGLDTSQVTNMAYMFANYGINDIDNIVEMLNTSSVTNMSSMFTGSRISVIPTTYDTSNVTNMNSMFGSCMNLTEIPQLDTRKVVNIASFVLGCTQLTTISGIDMIKVTSAYSMFLNCTALTNLNLKNIKAQLTIGSGTSYGHLLTDESIINTAKELWDFTGSSSKTLTVSTPSNARLDAIYVKLIEATEDMIANDEYITNKKPCIVCDSTDEGAMTLREFILSKNWTIA